MQYQLPKLKIRDPSLQQKITTYCKKTLIEEQSFFQTYHHSPEVRRQIAAKRYHHENLSIQERRIKRLNSSKKVKGFQTQIKQVLQSCDTSLNTSMVSEKGCYSIIEQSVDAQYGKQSSIDSSAIDFELECKMSNNETHIKFDTLTNYSIKGKNGVRQLRHALSTINEPDNLSQICRFELKSQSLQEDFDQIKDSSLYQSTYLDDTLNTVRQVSQKPNKQLTLSERFNKYLYSSLDCKSDCKTGIALLNQETTIVMVSSKKLMEPQKSNLSVSQRELLEQTHNPVHYQRKLRMKIHQNRLHTKDPSKQEKNMKLIYYLVQNFPDFIKYLHGKRQTKIIELYSRSMVFCQDVQSCEAFLKLTVMIGTHYFDILDYNKSSFFLCQSLIIGNLFQDFSSNIQILILLSKICNRFQNYCTSIRLKLHEIAVELLKRALEYSWYVDELDSELQIYDMFGITYYYSGSIQQAYMFHERFMTGSNEPRNNRVRLNSINYDFQQSEYDKQHNLKQYLSSYNKHIRNHNTCIPYFLIQTQDDKTMIHPTCDQFRTVTYKNSHAKNSLVRICQDKINNSFLDLSNLQKPFDTQFQVLNTSSQSEENQTDSQQLKKRIMNHFGYVGALHVAIPQSIVAIKQRLVKQEIKDRKINYFSGVYKLHSDQLIQQRNKQFPNLTKIHTQIHDSMEQNILFASLLKQKWEPIMIKHLNRSEQFIVEGSHYIKKYRKILESIIMNLY